MILNRPRTGTVQATRLSPVRPVAFRPCFTTGLAITLIKHYEKGFVQKKECNIKKELLLMATRLSPKRPVAFRPRFTTGLALIHNGELSHRTA